MQVSWQQCYLTSSRVQYACLRCRDLNSVCVLQAAVLHDTVEDTQTTLDEIGDRFGPEVKRTGG